MERIDSKSLQKKFLYKLEKENFDFAFENIFLYKRESDIIAFKDGFIHEFEFKTGESDFRKDIKKGRHNDQMPNYFYYVVSNENIIKGDYIEYAGIYTYKINNEGFVYFKLIKPPNLIRDYDVRKSELYSLLRKIYKKKNA